LPDHGPLRISSFTANDIQGWLTLSARRLLFFAILPVDTGWVLLANGQPVALESVFGGLLGAVLPAGEYTLRLRYQDPYVHLGTLVSGLSLGLLLLLVGHGCWQAWRERPADRSNRPEIA
jgi:uncharacterized membrane protein YfhO